MPNVDSSAEQGPESEPGAGIVREPDEERTTVAAVFGAPYQADGKTLIPVARVVKFGSGLMLARRVGGFSAATPVALVEVDQGRTTISPIAKPFPVALALLVGAWNLYWIARTLRELLRRTR